MPRLSDDDCLSIRQSLGKILARSPAEQAIDAKARIEIERAHRPFVLMVSETAAKALLAEDHFRRWVLEAVADSLPVAFVTNAPFRSMLTMRLEARFDHLLNDRLDEIFDELDTKAMIAHLIKHRLTQAETRAKSRTKESARAARPTNTRKRR